MAGVIIRHPDGREYAIDESDFRKAKVDIDGKKTYADLGFEIVSYEDGEEYTKNKPAEERAPEPAPEHG